MLNPCIYIIINEKITVGSHLMRSISSPTCPHYSKTLMEKCICTLYLPQMLQKKIKVKHNEHKYKEGVFMLKWLTCRIMKSWWMSSNSSHAIMFTFKQMLLGMCNIMAKGFHFMPLGLVRLRTFRLSAWVTIAQMGNGARECGWHHVPEAREDFGDFEKVS